MHQDFMYVSIYTYLKSDIIGTYITMKLNSWTIIFQANSHLSCLNICNTGYHKSLWYHKKKPWMNMPVAENMTHTKYCLKELERFICCKHQEAYKLHLGEKATLKC